jgi:hypothetical protein
LSNREPHRHIDVAHGFWRSVVALIAIDLEFIRANLPLHDKQLGLGAKLAVEPSPETGDL